MAESILIVDDEDSVRQTFEEWLAADFPEVKVKSAADAATALKAARDEPIDLAILDWNLGAGANGLQLLEDLQVFRPDLVAILVTGYASQATPLHALRMGVRDYFDKSRDLSRETLQKAVERQLRLIRPLKREREVREQLGRFQQAAEEALAYVRTGGPTPGAEAFGQIARRLLEFIMASTQATAAHLVWRSLAGGEAAGEVRLRFRDAGPSLEEREPPFGQTLAAAALLQSAGPLPVDLAQARDQWNLKLAAEEARHGHALLLPLKLGGHLAAVVELFDKPGGFGAEDLRFVGEAAPLFADLLRLAAGQQETQRLLLEALEAALRTSKLTDDGAIRSAELRASVQRSLASSSFHDLESPEAMALTEQLKSLAQRHGPSAMRHALAILKDVQSLLDEQQGMETPA